MQYPLVLFFAPISPHLPPKPVLVKQCCRYFDHIFACLIYSCLVSLHLNSNYTLHKCSHLAYHFFVFLNKATGPRFKAQVYKRQVISRFSWESERSLVLMLDDVWGELREGKKKHPAFSMRLPQVTANAFFLNIGLFTDSEMVG